MSRSFEAVPYSPVPHGDDYFTLPVADASRGESGCPSAFLSTLSAGSMNYEPRYGNPVRDAWLGRRGFGPENVLALSLAHSRIVLTAAEPGDLASAEADGILTANKSMCAVVTVADCMPIFLYDRASGAFGVLHSGWKGTGILKRAFELLKSEWGSVPEDIFITLGPCVGPCCYPVDEARAGAFAGELGPDAVTVIDGRPRLDLLAANLSLARQCGAAGVNYTDTCTSCDGRLGSFRRQGAEAFTRMAACIGFPPEASP